MKALVTGVAGFIGSFVARRLLDAGFEVVGIDNLNAYYDVQLKLDRLTLLRSRAGFTFERCELADAEGTARAFKVAPPEVVVHLAAQAGVRYSLENPRAYVDSNIVGFLNVLEECRRHSVRHLVFASSSSVYGGNIKVPFSENDNVDHPESLYAATKKANELMAHSYSHIYGLPVTGLRFFTVYGPWGRPDMAPMLFSKAILSGKPIQVFNHGKLTRDFTYVDDIVEGVVRVLPHAPIFNPTWRSDGCEVSRSTAPYRIYNIGNDRPVGLLDFIHALETALGRKATLVMAPMQPGDVLATHADVSALEQAVGFRPSTSLEVGLARLAEWYLGYYGSDGEPRRG
jgi:UDP-glucuronate 4-epimerase